MDWILILCLRSFSEDYRVACLFSILNRVFTLYKGSPHGMVGWKYGISKLLGKLSVMLFSRGLILSSYAHETLLLSDYDFSCEIIFGILLLQWCHFLCEINSRQGLQIC